MAITRNKNQTKRKPQDVLISSYDEDFDLLAVELIGFEPTASEAHRVRVNSSGQLVMGEASGTADDFEGGPVTVGTTAVEITFTGTPNSIQIQSDPDNTGKIWIGKSNITNSGGNAMAELSPGQALTVELNDTSNAIYAISDTASQNVFKLALV